MAQWLSGRMLDLKSLGRGFDSHSRQLRSNLGQVVHTYVPLSAGLAESNGSLLPGNDLKSQLLAD